MLDMMQILDSINSTKESIIDENNENLYPAFQINRGMAQHIDTIMLAQEMNKMSGLPNQMQYDFYLNVVTKRKRYGKWVKAVATEEDLRFVAEHYRISITKAEEYLALLSPDELQELKARYFTGGSTKSVDKPKRSK